MKLCSTYKWLMFICAYTKLTFWFCRWSLLDRVRRVMRWRIITKEQMRWKSPLKGTSGATIVNIVEFVGLRRILYGRTCLPTRRYVHTPFWCCFCHFVIENFDWRDLVMWFLDHLIEAYMLRFLNFGKFIAYLRHILKLINCSKISKFVITCYC